MKRGIVFAWGLFGILMFTYALPATEALFSPDDRPKNKLMTFLASAKKKIYAAVYLFTDKDLAQALVEAKKRGVDVRVVVDPSSIATQYAQVFALLKSKIPVLVFDTKQHHVSDSRIRAFAPLMHNKFAVVDGVVWTGSFNWTQSANSRNQENVIITDDKAVCQKYEKQFVVLTQRCRTLVENESRPEGNPFWRGPLKKLRLWLGM